MIYTAIYQIKLNKSTQRLYNLWGKPLIALQEKYIKTIEKMLGRWYKEVLQTIKDNPEVKINDLMVDQKQFINKAISNSDFDEMSEMMTKGFNIWAKQLNQAFKKDIRVDATFNVDPMDALRYAKDNAGAKIKGIDDYSKKRVNDLVTQGIENGWWYNKLANEIKRDFAFSAYRARLIASQEIGQAYLSGKATQFERYTTRFNQRGWKKWVSHKDDRTTEGCLHNDEAGWIPYDQLFPSGHMWPTRFPWCRCNCVYRLFDPRDQGENLTIENATPVDEIQSYIPEDWADGIKPENYDTYSTKVLPASYFNEIWSKATYKRTVWKSAFYRRYDDIVELWATTWSYKDRVTEVHEVGHFFLTRAVLQNEERFLKLKTIFKTSIDEVKDLAKDKELRSIFNPHHTWNTVGQKLMDKYSDLDGIASYSIKKEIKTVGTREIEKVILSEELKEDVGSLMDTLGALTKEAIVWNGHGKSYYKNSTLMFTHGQAKITEKQLQEYFAHLNEVHWIGNPLIEKFLPETYKAMKEYYASIGLDFIA